MGSINTLLIAQSRNNLKHGQTLGNIHAPAQAGRIEIIYAVFCYTGIMYFGKR